MRQRITFLQKEEYSSDPADLVVTDTSISTSTLRGAREDQFTFDLTELPDELRVLVNLKDIQVRWVTERAFDVIPPLVSRLTPGLHVLYTPLEGGQIPKLCSLLRDAFGDINCISTKDSFTTLPKKPDAHAATAQLYTPLVSIDKFARYFATVLCSLAEDKRECLSRSALLKTAASLDFEMDLFANKFTVTAYWAPQIWTNLSITKGDDLVDKSEIGILAPSKSTETYQNTLGGLLTVLGEHKKPVPTLFSFSSRHHATNQTFDSSFLLPTGLHPTVELALSSGKPPVDDLECKLHAHLTLPKEVFVDKYQLSDPLFMASKHLSTLKYITTPVDLEAPAYAVDIWGSTVLVELAPPSAEKEWTAQIPFHLRYLAPHSGKEGQEKLKVPYPVVFWACEGETLLNLENNPFDKKDLGYDGLFEAGTLFYHVNPQPAAEGQEKLVSELSVPVLDLDRSGYVEYGTAIVVGLGFAWVLWSLIRVFIGKSTTEKQPVGKEGLEKKVQ